MQKVDNQKTLGILISFFVMVIIGLSLFLPTSDVIEGATGTSSTNQSFTALNRTAVNVSYDDWVEGSAIIMNSSDNINLDNFTINYPTGEVTLIATIDYNNTPLNISYDFLPDDYIKNSAARSMVRLILIFFALAIFGASVGYLYKLLKSSGIEF